ncbi:MAG: hypothetical protein JSS86_02635 [Cyanobacteria bacterium SZAS LIN-2]|nr:hypothetical protein [Cyanobacteria bacterium SZAS LIN-2]
MKCASCDVYIEPSYMPCPQCKRRAGYTLIEDTSRCDDIFEQAFTVLHADQLATSTLLPINTRAIVEKNWWAAATEGSFSAKEIEGIEDICAEMKIERLIALLPQSSPTEDGKTSIGLAFVETSEDALRNFSWDYPSSFVLFPPAMEFLLCQYSHPAILAAGPKMLVERVFNMSVEDAIEQFKEDMFNSDAATLAAYLIENVIEPANSSAAK